MGIYVDDITLPKENGMYEYTCRLHVQDGKYKLAIESKASDFNSEITIHNVVED